VVKILQGSVVTQTTLGDLTIYPQFANFLQCICAKNYENWLAVDKVIAKIIRLTFFWPTLYIIGQLIFHCEISVQSPVVCDISHYSVRWQMANYGMCTMYIYIKWIGLCDYNPTLEANTKWIGWRVAEIWPFEIFQNGWSYVRQYLYSLHWCHTPLSLRTLRARSKNDFSNSQASVAKHRRYVTLVISLPLPYSIPCLAHWAIQLLHSCLWIIRTRTSSQVPMWLHYCRCLS